VNISHMMPDTAGYLNTNKLHSSNSKLTRAFYTRNIGVTLNN